MDIYLTNTLSSKLEKFLPIKKNRVGLYVCGLTPYDGSHLGHARVYIFFDIVRRTFEALGTRVLHVQNFTDIDDKILARSKELQISPLNLSAKFIGEYFNAFDALNVKRAHHYPRVTQNIPQIIEAIQNLVQKGLAYQADNGDVYYQTNAFKSYGKLSKKKIEDLIAGSRVEVSPHKKEPGDFALWKSDSQSELAWESSWSRGRPGWHIECSVMSARFLGQPFDIHGGGEDLIFPHHENEIAQSEGPEGIPFANYFLHVGFLTLNKEKMSKSTGNFFTLKDILTKHSGNAIRYYLLTEYYRRALDYTSERLLEASKAWQRVEEAMDLAQFALSQNQILKKSKATALQSKPFKGPISSKIHQCLTQDFHTPNALAYLQAWAGNIFIQFKNKALPLNQTQNDLNDMRWALDKLLGFELPKKSPRQSAAVNKLVAQRELYREKKEFTQSDEIRQKLAQEFNVTLEDTPYGPRLKDVKRKT